MPLPPSDVANVPMEPDVVDSVMSLPAILSLPPAVSAPCAAMKTSP